MEEKIFSIPVRIVCGADKIHLVVSVGETLDDAIETLRQEYLGTTLMEEINECVAFTTDIYTKEDEKYIGMCVDFSKIDSKKELANTVIHLSLIHI